MFQSWLVLVVGELSVVGGPIDQLRLTGAHTELIRLNDNQPASGCLSIESRENSHMVRHLAMWLNDDECHIINRQTVDEQQMTLSKLPLSLCDYSTSGNPL